MSSEDLLGNCVCVLCGEKGYFNHSVSCMFNTWRFYIDFAPMDMNNRKDSDFPPEEIQPAIDHINQLKAERKSLNDEWIEILTKINKLDEEIGMLRGYEARGELWMLSGRLNPKSPIPEILKRGNDEKEEPSGDLSDSGGGSKDTETG